MELELERKYQLLKVKLHLKNEDRNGKYGCIKQGLKDFVGICSNVAIWCYGEHTKMLMTDFIFEMKSVKYVIEKKRLNDAGFIFITENEIIDNNIDGIIISSFKYRNEISRKIEKDYPNVKVFDMYDYLKKNGFECESEYYQDSHPYDIYKKINNYMIAIKDNKRDLIALKNIIIAFVTIMDFKNAIYYTKKYLSFCNDDIYEEVLKCLDDIYKLQINMLSKISNENVLMLCFDGLRQKDISEGKLPRLKKMLEKRALIFNNAYSISTSTFESLIPAYSENYDFKTKYYNQNIIRPENCRFVNCAIETTNNVHFYTDTIKFVDNNKIDVKQTMQTATQKMWYFLLDAYKNPRGLYYVHLLYESHFSYPSPYTNSRLIAEGTSIFFDYLPVNGGKLKTDYARQHVDALHYLDDVIVPQLERLDVPMVIFADHGNVVLEKNFAPSNVEYSMLTFSNDLVRIPMAVISPWQGVGIENGLMSLNEINNIIICLLNKKKYPINEKKYVKIQRSEIYNPDFKYLFKKWGYAKGLQAFEGFIFASGYKFIIYASGKCELYDAEDNQIVDDKKIEILKSEIQDEITII